MMSCWGEYEHFTSYERTIMGAILITASINQKLQANDAAVPFLMINQLKYWHKAFDKQIPVY